MAILLPTFENVLRLRPTPTEGEIHMLEFLRDNLDDTYEIYFQPFLNGDNPDIVVMRKNSGVWIIEVKDWNLRHYAIDDERKWSLNIPGNNSSIKSPLQQVYQYKENIYNLHIPKLLEKRIKNSKMLAIVNCAVYFHNAREEELNKFLKEKHENHSSYIRFLSYFDLLGRDSLTFENLKQNLHKRRLDVNSVLFDDTLYNSFRRYFQPSIHKIEQGIDIVYSKEQLELIDSKIGLQKVKGIAGAGKTMVLAKRAVNAHKRLGERILILTYNISLRNYVSDKLSEVKEEFNKNSFYIINYHDFITTEMNNHGIEFEIPSNFDELNSNEKSSFFEENYYSNLNLFEGVKDNLIKFKAIFIDEVQDYKTEWIRIIRKYFFEEEGELVLFGDEKQNIFNRDLDEEKKPNTTIPGRWNEKLKESFRLSAKIAKIAMLFQKEFFSIKYNPDEIIISRRPKSKVFEAPEYIEYHLLGASYHNEFKGIVDVINKINSPPNDIVILSEKISILREFDFYIRKNTREKTNTMFETQEIYLFLKNKVNNPRKFSKEIENIKKHKKIHFWMNSGTLKLSTIHSFKGWEIPTLVLLISHNEKIEDIGVAEDELVYTGITRCRHNLIIINLGNKKYHKFFQTILPPIVVQTV